MFPRCILNHWRPGRVLRAFRSGERLPIILVGLGAVGLGLAIFKLTRSPQASTLPSASAPGSQVEATVAKPPRLLPDPERPRPALPAAELSPELGAIFAKLRENFGPGGSKPNRFRLQRQLSLLWGETPPVEILLHEATDPSAPPDYRAHFVRRLLSFGKTASPESGGQLAAEMRAALASAPTGSHGLAQALLGFDDSPTNIAAVKQLLDRASDDPESAGLVAALTLSNSADAHEAVWDFSRAISDQPDHFPRTLVTALPPLARIPELEVEPVLQRVLAGSSSLPLYATAIESCFARQPSEASLAVIRLAHQRSTQFGADQQERIHGLLRAGLLRWQRQSANASPAQSEGIETLLNQI